MKIKSILLCGLFGVMVACGQKSDEASDKNETLATSSDDLLQDFYDMLFLTEGEGIEIEEEAETEAIEAEIGGFVDDGSDSQASDENSDDGDDSSTKGDKEEIKAARLAVREKLSSLREQRKEICSKVSDLHKTLSSSLDEIKSDDQLSDEEKKIAAKSLFDENREALKEKREEYRECVDNNKGELLVIWDEAKNVIETCLARPMHASENTHRSKIARHRKVNFLFPKDAKESRRTYIKEKVKESREKRQAGALKENLLSDECSALLN